MGFCNFVFRVKSHGKWCLSNKKKKSLRIHSFRKEEDEQLKKKSKGTKEQLLTQ